MASEWSNICSGPFHNIVLVCPHELPANHLCFKPIATWPPHSNSIPSLVLVHHAQKAMINNLLMLPTPNRLKAKNIGTLHDMFTHDCCGTVCNHDCGAQYYHTAEVWKSKSQNTSIWFHSPFTALDGSFDKKFDYAARLKSHPAVSHVLAKEKSVVDKHPHLHVKLMHHIAKNVRRIFLGRTWTLSRNFCRQHESHRGVGGDRSRKGFAKDESLHRFIFQLSLLPWHPFTNNWRKWQLITGCLNGTTYGNHVLAQHVQTIGNNQSIITLD